MSTQFQDSLKSRFRPRCGGFSLPELLVVVVIIGILSAIAIPQYNDYLRRAALTDATATIADYRIRLEQYFQDNRNYGSATGVTCTDPGSGTPQVSLPTSTKFNFTCVTASSNGTSVDNYLVTATSLGGYGLGANDFIYTLNHANARATTKYKGLSVTKTCWLIGGSEC